MRSSVKMLLQQTLDDFELIVVDDQSTDHTAQVVAELMLQDERVKYHCLSEKRFVAGAMNAGILLSQGDYIQICHDHDIYISTLTEKMADLMDRHPSVMFVHSGRQGCDHEGNPLRHAYFVMGYPEVSSGQAWRKRMLKRLASPVTALSMIRRAALEQNGLFDLEFGASSDIDLWMRLCTIGDVGYVNELLLFVRGRGPDHPYTGNWDITDQVIRTHRKHLKLTFHGLEYWAHKLTREWEIDCSLTFDYLNSIRHRRWRDRDNGRVYLRKHGVLFSRVLAHLL